MIELNFAGGPFGDETRIYHVKTDATYVVQFIGQVLKERGNEWGG